jgi:hypothetical protein
MSKCPACGKTDPKHTETCPIKGPDPNEELTPAWLQHEIYDLLSNKYSIFSEDPKFIVGLRGTDLVAFMPGGEQILILIQRAI